MTLTIMSGRTPNIIPYQELLGNYDRYRKKGRASAIIPYQELLGNYDRFRTVRPSATIIPYQELLGNYDCEGYINDNGRYYTIPRAIREL